MESVASLIRGGNVSSAKPAGATNQATPRQAFALRFGVGQHSREHRQMTMAPKSNVPHVMPPIIPRNSLILVGDGQKALFLRNRGSAQRIDLVVERILEQENPATREQGTDRPGRSIASVGVARSAMEEADWHHIAKERFANEIAKALYHHAHANLFERLIIIAPPKILGKLRKAFHPEVLERIAAEIPKELTSHPVPEIGKLIAA